MFEVIRKNGLSILAGVVALTLVGTATVSAQDDYIYQDTSTDTTYDTLDSTYDWSYDTSTSNLTDEEAAGVAAFMTGIGIVFWLVGMVVGLAMYVYQALAYSKIAQKLNHPNGWFAWVPVLNVVLMLQMAGMSGWLVLTLLIPGFNVIIALVLAVMSMMKIAEKRGFESWLGLLVIVPIANIILPGYLAWAEPKGAKPVQPASPAPEATPMN